MPRKTDSDFDLLLPIGDMHVKKDDVEEAKKFITWIVEGVLALNKSTGRRVLPVFMGDQYNDFSLANVVVAEFWTWAYKYMLQNLGYPPLSLQGNHDMNQEESASIMTVHSDFTVVVGRDPVFIRKDTAAIGFIRNEDLFYSKVMEAYNAGARRVFCHAEFQGCQYENGFYAPHGFDLSKYPADLLFFSGHIHMRQSFGNVTFFGTPRHLTRSDIGEVKGVHIMDLAANTLQFQPTPKEVWAPFVHIEIDEKDPDLKTKLAALSEAAKLNPTKVYVDVKGTRDFVQKTTREIPAVKTRSTYTDELVEVKMKESDGIPAAFTRFSSEFFDAAQVPKGLREDVLKRVYEKCPTLRSGVS